MYFPDLVAEYKQSLQDLREAGGCASMERDMLEAIKWMETTYDPAEYRAATRQDVCVMDHHLMQDLIVYVDSDQITPDVIAGVIDCNYDDSAAREIERLFYIKDTVNNAMKGLTENERFVFIMIRAEQVSFGKLARLLGVTKSTVQTHLRRAESKIHKNVSRKIA